MFLAIRIHVLTKKGPYLQIATLYNSFLISCLLYPQINNAGVGGANVNVHVLKAQIAQVQFPKLLLRLKSILSLRGT